VVSYTNISATLSDLMQGSFLWSNRL